jgi:glycosyltransferase involved in cell wall biosynthesis
MGVPAAWIARTPVIISSQRDLAHLPWYTPFRRKVIARVHRLADRVVANCSAVRDMLLSEMGIPEDHVCTIRNGVNVERLAQIPNQRRLLFPEITDEQKLVAVVANMSSPVKGHAYLLDAARKLRESVPGVVFVLIGDGPLRAGLERDVSDAKLDERFIFLGRRNDTASLLRCCNFLLLPSVAEGLPNALLEGMAAGLPVIATRVGGVPEIIEDGVTGVLVEPKSPNAIAEAIIRMVQRPELARRVSLAAYERICGSFGFDRVIEQLIQLYVSVAKQREISTPQPG